MLTSVLLSLLLTAPPVPSEPPVSAGSRFIQRGWDTADGLPQNSVTAIVQTRDGYLWLGTFGGLVRFDGQAFTVFEPANAPGLPNSRIIALYEDRQGTLWIGTESGLARYADGRFTGFTSHHGIPMGAVRTVLQDRQGRIWAGTDGGLVRFDGHAFVSVPIPGVERTALSLAETPDGILWVSMWNGVFKLQLGVPPVVAMPTTDITAVRKLFVDSKGRLWAGGGGLRRWDGARFVTVPLPTATVDDDAITDFTEDATATLWIGTWNGGLHTWRDDAVERVPDPAGTGGAIRTLARDRDNNIWIGTDVGGLRRLKPRHVFSYQRTGVVEQSIGPIVGDGHGGLWIGATCGGLQHFSEGRFRGYHMADGVPHECVWALHRDVDGTLWIGTMGGGLGRLLDGKFTQWTESNGLPSPVVLGVMRTRDGALWVGTGKGVSRFDGRTFTNYGADAGVPPEIRAITEDHAGTLWLGGLGGLTRFSNGVFTTFSTAQGLSNNQVRAIYEDSEHVLWIGTYGGGLNRFKDGRFTSFTTKDGLQDNAVSRIIEDERGDLWMSGNKGVFRVARRQLNDFAEGRAAFITSVAYGTADGMIIDETNGGQPAGWRTPDGRLWFPTIKGLVSIEPDTAPASQPPVFVEHTVANGRDAEFHFTAVDLSAAEKTRFRYRLNGYDRGWIESGARRAAYYTNLPPGRFQFEVMATNGDGVWSTTTGLATLVVPPAWWERREVQLIALVLLLTMTGAGVRFVSLRRARAQLAELRREQALDRERSRIARDLHDDLGSRLSHIAFMADRVASGKPDERLADAARSAVQTMDELVWAVNARNDTVESFAYYVAQYAEEHVAAAGLRCRLVLPATLPARPLAADTRRHLFLAFKEAINNALKHARASEIRLSLAAGPSSLILEVSDDGRGLSAEAMDPNGNGLANLRERMEAVHGSLNTTSLPGEGTSVTFTVPLPPEGHVHALVDGTLPRNTDAMRGVR